MVYPDVSVEVEKTANKTIYLIPAISSSGQRVRTQRLRVRFAREICLVKTQTVRRSDQSAGKKK